MGSGRTDRASPTTSDVGGNEAWRYDDLRPEAIDHVCCPRMYPDPIQDPRMQQWPAVSEDR